MADKPIPGSYIDTQGMGGPLSPEEAKNAKKQEYKPAIVLFINGFKEFSLIDFQFSTLIP